jgi:hypothetical protein
MSIDGLRKRSRSLKKFLAGLLFNAPARLSLKHKQIDFLPVDKEMI